MTIVTLQLLTKHILSSFTFIFSALLFDSFSLLLEYSLVSLYPPLFFTFFLYYHCPFSYSYLLNEETLSEFFFFNFP